MPFECQRVLIISFFFFVFSFSKVQAFEVSPDKKFIVIHTPHFQVIVNAKQQELGQYYSKYLEVSYDFLKNYFSQMPESTTVILNDKTDSANGYATRVPYPHIMLYPVLPSATDSLGETGHWPLELATHEYTHILNFEAGPGLVGFLRNIFGNVMAPNILLPNWWKEGLAVQMETSVGSHGRLRSVYQDAALRAIHIDKRLSDFDIAEINENIPTWPEGMRSYLFGSLMWSQIVADQSADVIDKLNQRHGSRVPYFLNGAAKSFLGQSYGSEYNKVIEQLEIRLNDQLSTLGKLRPTKSETILPEIKYSSAPSVSPNGKFLATITVDAKNDRSVQIYAKNDSNNFLNAKLASEATESQEPSPQSKIYDAPAGGSIHRVVWTPDSQKIVYDKIDRANPIDSFSDLYIYDIKNKKTDQLTTAQRAREPAISPDGNDIAFVLLGPSKTGLALLNLKTKKVELLKTFALGERASYPTFLNSDRILFSLRTIKGDEKIYTLDLKSQKLEKHFSEYPNARFPQVTSEGIYFTSSKNGIHNIYLSSLDFQKIKPITHTLTSFLTFSVDSTTKDIYATEITPNGPKISWIAQKNFLAPNAQLPVVKSLLEDRYKDREIPEVPKENYPTEEYSSWNQLGPHYWIPFLSTSSQGQGVLFQAMTSGFDPLKKHAYELQGSWDTGIQKPSFSGSYLNSQFWTKWGLQAFQTNSYFVTTTNSLTNTGGQISLYPNLFSLSRYLNASLSWKYLSTDLSNSTNVKRTGPGLVVGYENYSMGGDQISPEEGSAYYAGVTHYVPQGEYLSHTQYLAGLTAYWSKWLPERHSIMVKMNSLYTPEDILSVLGVSTLSQMPLQDSSAPNYVMRGYTNGHFLGRTMANMNLEYRFPIRNIYRGSGTDPLFSRRLHGAIVADALSLEGLAYRSADQAFESVSTNKYFFSAGAELRFDMTLGYVIPITFVVGGYQGLSGSYAPPTQLGITMQIGAKF